MCTCSSFSFLLIFICSVISQVIMMAANAFDCDVDDALLTLLWLQTIFCLLSIVYVCLPLLYSITKLFYLNILPSLFIFVFSLYLAYFFIANNSTCSVYSNDMQPLLNAAMFSQGIIPVLAFIVCSGELNKSCRTTTYKKMNAFDTEEDWLKLYIIYKIY